MRVLESVGAADRHVERKLHGPAARGLRTNRHSAEAELDGRGHDSLVGVLGSHLD
jgi:hypothetical protein